MEKRERFSSRLGFLLISAGCAIGVGNVWKFPYITGMYGGAAFVLIYLLFLLILALPILTIEFSVGRASRRSCARSFHVLEPKGTHWHLYSWLSMAGNYLLLMFYTAVAGWMPAYLLKFLRGDLVNVTPEQAGAAFQALLDSPGTQIFWMLVISVVGFGICRLGLRKGVEKFIKPMMLCLVVLMLVLAGHSLLLPGAAEGLKFYLVPDLHRLMDAGIGNVIYAALGQAFFTLSVGIGAMAIFGSYVDKERTLLSESVKITALDTFAALTAGLIIFPACSAYGLDPGQGPGLVFVTLPQIFGGMPGGRIWGALFFLFMSCAVLSTVVAGFENVVTFGMELQNWSRKKAVLINLILVPILTLPCILGFNVWASVTPFGPGSTLMDLEDFLVSNNLLPLGSLVYLTFCTTRWGWGWDAFMAEANTGKGMRFPKAVRFYMTYILPLIVLFIFVMGYRDKFF